MLKKFLENTSKELSNGKPNFLKKHPLANSITKEGPMIIKSLLPKKLQDYQVKASAGQGSWANVPWIAIYNTAITDKISSGYFIVYLIPHSSNSIILGLTQSFEEAKKEFGAKNYEQNLDKQAEIMRMKISNFSSYFKSSSPEFKINKQSYSRPGHVYHIKYDTKKLPSEEILIDDFNKMLKAYETLFFKGGRDSDSFLIIDEKNKSLSIEETYKKKVHFSIERPNRNEIKKIKDKLGYVCQACNFDFQKVYGEIGCEYIEAHHLKPISELKVGESRNTSEKDFAVLCANCHRMIHKLEDCSNIYQLKELISKKS